MKNTVTTSARSVRLRLAQAPSRFHHMIECIIDEAPSERGPHASRALSELSDVASWYLVHVLLQDSPDLAVHRIHVEAAVDCYALQSLPTECKILGCIDVFLLCAKFVTCRVPGCRSVVPVSRTRFVGDSLIRSFSAISFTFIQVLSRIRSTRLKNTHKKQSSAGSQF